MSVCRNPYPQRLPEAMSSQGSSSLYNEPDMRHNRFVNMSDIVHDTKVGYNPFLSGAPEGIVVPRHLRSCVISMSDPEVLDAVHALMALGTGRP